MMMTVRDDGVSFTLSGARGVLELVMRLRSNGEILTALIHHDDTVCDNLTHSECDAEADAGDDMAELWRANPDDDSALAEAMSHYYADWASWAPRNPLDNPALIAGIRAQLDGDA